MSALPAAALGLRRAAARSAALVGLGLLLLLLGWTLVLAPARAERAAAEQEAALLEEKLRAARDFAARARAEELEAAALRETAERLTARLASLERVADLARAIRDAARVERLVIVAETPFEPAREPPDRAGEAPRPQTPKNGLLRFRKTISLLGDFAGARRLVAALEALPDVARVSGFRIKRAGAGTDPLAVEVEIEVLKRVE